jgi:hypothetical protein
MPIKPPQRLQTGLGLSSEERQRKQQGKAMVVESKIVAIGLSSKTSYVYEPRIFIFIYMFILISCSAIS